NNNPTLPSIPTRRSSDLQKDVVNAKRQLGLVPQEFNFNPFETVQQIVVNQAGYYGVERKEALERSEKYLKQLDLWEKRNECARIDRKSTRLNFSHVKISY